MTRTLRESWKLSFALCVAFLASQQLSSAKKATHDVSEEKASALFRSWISEYHKDYKSTVEVAKRFKVFHKNLNKISALNKQYEGQTVFAANQFADMSEEDFQNTILMPTQPAPIFPKHRYSAPTGVTSLPETFDWRDRHMVTTVKNQGSTGTCWAFSTIGNLEGQWGMQGKPMTNLSVEQVVDCDGNKDPKQGNADCGVFGGWPYLAYQYVQRAGGIETENDYKYCCGVEKDFCMVCPAAGYNSTLCGPSVPYCNMTQSCAAKIDKSKFVPGLKVVNWTAISENETEIASQLMTIGPLSIALNANPLQFYHSGVMNPILCNKKGLNHAVLLVGFGSHKGIFGTTPYWLVKNSWGPKWGEHGYFLIKRGAGVCGINTQVTSAILAK